MFTIFEKEDKISQSNYVKGEKGKGKKPFLGLTHLAFPRPLRETKRTAEMFEACEPVGAGTSERAAFTLAEVLITLGIIGTVAAMTIPTLISNIDKRDRYSGLLKSMSVISEASERIRMENGNSMAGLATDNNTFMNLFATYLKPIKICNANDYSCYLESTDTVHELKGGGYADTYTLKYPKIVTADGFVSWFYFSNSSCQGVYYQRNGQSEQCGVVYVDINGTKEPNTMGKDIWTISINKYNTTPYWDMTSPSYTINTGCNPSAASGTSYNGVSCGAKAITDGGIKYY